MTVPNGVAALVLVALLAVMTVAFWRLSSRAVLPVALHNGVWAVALLGVASNLIHYREATVEAWATLVLGLVFFNIGSAIGAARGEQRMRGSESIESAPGSANVGILSRTSFFVLAALYAVGFAVYLGVTIARFGWETFLFSPELVRAAPESYLAAVPLWARLLLYIGPFLLAVLLIRAGVRGRVPLLPRVIMLLVLVITMLALLQRTNLFAGTLWAIAALLLLARRKPAQPPSREPRNLRSLLRSRAARGGALALVLILSSFVAFQAVGAALGKTGDSAAARSTVSPILGATGMTNPFIYVTAGTPAFLLLTESRNEDWPPLDRPRVLFGDYNPQTWGAATFEPVVSLIPGARPWNPIGAFVDVGTFTNVFTWLEMFYRDFREIGVAVATFAMGLVITYAYRTRNLSPRRFWLAALLVSTLFLAPFVFKLNTALYVVSALVVIAVSSPLIARVSTTLNERRSRWSAK